MKRQEHLTEVEEVAIRVRVERLKGGRYLGTSRDVPGLVAEGRSVAETVEIAQGLARKIVESCLDRKSTRLNSSHGYISYAVFCLKKKKKYVTTKSQHSLRAYVTPLTHPPSPHQIARPTCTIASAARRAHPTQRILIPFSFIRRRM